MAEKAITLNELIGRLTAEQKKHGEEVVSYEVNRDSLDILIGEDPDTGTAVTIPNPGW